jgi:integrase
MAKRRRWVATNPMEEVPKPKTPSPERQIYTPKQFEDVLHWSELNYEDLLPYIVLSGYCFLRTAELVRMYANESVLQWSDIHWNDGLIHVRPGVAKGTQRESDERFIPI